MEIIFDSGAEVETTSRILGVPKSKWSMEFWAKYFRFGSCSFQSTCLGTKQGK